MSRSLALLAVSLVVFVAPSRADVPEGSVVLAAGKRNFIVITPPNPVSADFPKGFKLYSSTVYFGDAKSLVPVPYAGFDFNIEDDRETFSFTHPRLLNDGKLERIGGTYKLYCYARGGDENGDEREIAVTVASATAVAKATLTVPGPVRIGYLLGRVDGGTTYLYVDRLGYDDLVEPRIFLGKRGAMKQLKAKVTEDTKSVVIETPKGTLTVKKAQSKKEKATATFGSAKKPLALAMVPIFPNRRLIYTELGVYTRERLVHPCEEL